LFLEPRRRTARHFIKVEKKYNGLDRPHLAPIKVPLTTNYIRATGYDGNDPTIPGLGQVFTGPASSWLQALVGSLSTGGSTNQAIAQFLNISNNQYSF